MLNKKLIATANNIIKQLVAACSCVDHQFIQVKYKLKLHPACRLNETFNKLIAQLPESFVLTEERSFPALIKKANLLISEASSTCLEALACGIPVIVIQNSEGLTHNPIPDCIPEDLYMNVMSPDQLIFALNYYINSSAETKDKQRSSGNWIRENYFEPVTKEGINLLLNI